MKAGCALGSQVWNSTGAVTAALRKAASPELQDLGEFGGEGATGRLFAISSTALPAVGTLLNSGTSGIGGCCNRRLLLLLLRCARVFAFWRLCRVGPKKSIFQRCSVEAANNRVHPVARRRF